MYAVKFPPSLEVSLVLAFAACIVPAHAQTKAPAATRPGHIQPIYKPFAVTGEVVDTWCFSSRSVGLGRGPAHARCAAACAHGGVTLGIVDDAGNLYVASKTKAYQGCQFMLEPLVAKRVHAVGYLAKLGGCNIMKIDEVEEVGPDDKPLKRKGAETNSKTRQYHGGAAK